MKKITFLTLLLISSYSFSQNWTTGDVALSNTSHTVKYDVDTTNDMVTMTLVGPSTRWLGVAISNTSYSSGSSMGQFSGDDVMIYTNNTISDRSMPGSNGAPTADMSTQQDWIISSNTVNTGTRTVVATRVRDTGNTNDFVFPTTPPTSFTLVWALGDTNSENGFAYHNGGRGATLASNNVLSNDDFQLNPVKFSISPNPSSKDLNVKIAYNSGRDYMIEVYDILGKKIHKGELTKDNTSINVSNWRTGVYLVKLSSDDFTETKRFLKQ